jgi:hypothetical protein
MLQELFSCGMAPVISRPLLGQFWQIPIGDSTGPLPLSLLFISLYVRCLIIFFLFILSSKAQVK